MRQFSLPTFRDDALWQQAMTHRSFTNEQPDAPHNERLEFLGDAILNFLSGEYLYANYPNRPEGDLSQMREALVDESQLCHFANSLNLGQHLQLGRGASQNEGYNNSRLLCSAFEALVGAYFLDSDRSINPVRNYVWPFFDSAIANLTHHPIKNEKSRLQEWTQKRFGHPPEYVTLSTSGPDHNRAFLVEVRINNRACGKGRGHSKKAAQKAAARTALRSIAKTDTKL